MGEDSSTENLKTPSADIKLRRLPDNLRVDTGPLTQNTINTIKKGLLANDPHDTLHTLTTTNIQEETEPPELQPKRTLRQIGKGAVHTVSAIDRSTGTRYALSENYRSNDASETQKLREKEIQSYQRCLSFFKNHPTLIPAERWLPIPRDTDLTQVKSVRKLVDPFIDGDFSGSELGNNGIDPVILTDSMRQQLSDVLITTKNGILTAMESDNKIEGSVPDLRGENFMFDKNGLLKFVDTSSLMYVGSPTEKETSQIQEVVMRIIKIEMKYLDKPIDDIFADPFYQQTTKGMRDKLTNALATDTIFQTLEGQDKQLYIDGLLKNQILSSIGKRPVLV